MTNWPNIQEYRNFEAKFVNDPKRNAFVDSSPDSQSETVIRDEFKPNDDADDFANVHRLQGSECKTVRCVIRKDFEESFKKLDRGDGFALSNDSVRPAAQDTASLRQASVDKIRLQNHLKWKKQKEEEYLQKKEAERLAQQKKREEERRLERIKKQKEKEREEKIREWQEQKAREKEEKKREKIMMKELEEELKEVAPAVNKEKLIEEWIKLKNKQKQIEAEKKAEVLKKEEESRALRQNLAEISYRQWKERIKGRMMTLPKNGYQIFGPKPVPVVKEDWNHDFATSSPRDRGVGLRGAKSTTTTGLTFRTGTKDLDDLPKDVFYLGDNFLKNRSASFYHMKTAKSGLNLRDVNDGPHNPKMPLKELQPAAIDLKNLWSKEGGVEYWDKPEGVAPQSPADKWKANFKTNFKGSPSGWAQQPDDYLADLVYPLAEGDQNRCASTTALQSKKLSGLLTAFPEPQVLPNKKKIDLYINTGNGNVEEDEPPKPPKKQTSTVKIRKEEKKAVPERKAAEGTKKIVSRDNSCAGRERRPPSLLKRGTKSVDKSLNVAAKKPVEAEAPADKASRRSRSYDKATKFPRDKRKVKGCSSSGSLVKEDPARLAKSKVSSAQKRKSRKPSATELAKPEKPPEPEAKAKKKPKKNALSKSFSFIDSPYFVKNSKSLSKVKVGRRRSAKDREGRRDDPGQCRKLSATKI